MSGVTAALSSDDREVLSSLDSHDDDGDDSLGNLVKILPVVSLALLVGGGVVFKEPIVDSLNTFSDYLAGMGPSGFALYMAVRARPRRWWPPVRRRSLAVFFSPGLRSPDCPGATSLPSYITCGPLCLSTPLKPTPDPRFGVRRCTAGWSSWRCRPSR